MKLRIMESNGWEPMKVSYEELIQMIEDTANTEYGDIDTLFKVVLKRPNYWELFVNSYPLGYFTKLTLDTIIKEANRAAEEFPDVLFGNKIDDNMRYRAQQEQFYKELDNQVNKVVRVICQIIPSEAYD